MNYQICKKTVMDSSDPSISFDCDGVSNHYSDFQNITKPNWCPGQEGSVKIQECISKIKKEGKNRDYDCLLGLSGGLDSSYLLHKAVKEYGLRPLVFHVDGGWNSEKAVSNINSIVDKLGVDLYTEVINWDEMRDFQLAMFKAGVPHLDVPQDQAFISTLYKYSNKHNIKTILNGGNISTECVLSPLEFLYWPSDFIQINDILRRFGTVPMKTFPFSNIFYNRLYLRYIRSVNIFKPLNYINFIKREAISELEIEYGWKSYPQKHFESRFTRFFEGHWLPKRFGYDMRRNQLSSLILTNQITREEALNKLNEPSISNEDIMLEYDYIANKLGVSTDEMQGFMEMPKKYYWNYKNISGIFSIGERLLSVIESTRRGGAF